MVVDNIRKNGGALGTIVQYVLDNVQVVLDIVQNVLDNLGEPSQRTQMTAPTVGSAAFTTCLLALLEATVDSVTGVGGDSSPEF